MLTLAQIAKAIKNLRQARSLIQTDESRAALPSFREFVEEAWAAIEPGTTFVPGWHIDAICEHLEAVSRRDIQRLLVNMPPRHMKSILISVMWPMWTWLYEPSTQWLCASYALSLAIRDNRKCRILIQSPWFQRKYGHLFYLTSDQNVKGRFENNMRGYRLATSVGAATTGEGGSILLIDDAHPADDAYSDVQRLNTLQWFNETWSTRLNDQRTGAMVVVGQRIHHEDISGHLLQQGGWEHLNLPTEYESARRCVTGIGWSDERTQEGELLWPERFDQKTIALLKKQMGSMGYAAQFQQTPVPSGGGQYRSEWFRYFTETEEAYHLEADGHVRSLYKNRCTIFGTVDLAVSTKEHADYTVYAIWALTPDNDLLLLAVYRGRFSNPEQMKFLKRLHFQFMPAFWKIETVAYQLAFVQQALNEGIPCREYKPTKDKVSRATSGSVWYENGKIYHLKHAPWRADFEGELVLFPKASYDDQADQVPMAVDEALVTREIRPLDGGLIDAIQGYRGY